MMQSECQHCGYIGRGVGPRSGHVGGRGIVWRTVCEDSEACWRRWDKAHLDFDLRYENLIK